jgi:hypothetical protein
MGRETEQQTATSTAQTMVTDKWLPVSHVPKTPLGWPVQLIETTQPEFEALGVPKTSV